MARSCTFYCLPSLLDPFIPRQEPWGGSGMPAGVQSRNPEIGRRHGENTYRFFWFYYHNLTYTNSSITKKMIWLWVNSYFYTIWMWVIHIHLFTSYDLGWNIARYQGFDPSPCGSKTRSQHLLCKCQGTCSSQGSQGLGTWHHRSSSDLKLPIS